jgi:hypothetical protein
MAYAHRKALGFGALGMTAAFVTGIAGVAGAVLYGPLSQDAKLDKAVRHVAVVWHTEGDGAAGEQLRFEVARVSRHKTLTEEDCQRTSDDRGVRSVRCAWETRVAVPLSDLVVPLSFTSEVHISANGELR